MIRRQKAWLSRSKPRRARLKALKDGDGRLSAGTGAGDVGKQSQERQQVCRVHVG